jgi:dynein light intermediate chain
MIREVALECPERGLMLLRVRDELRLTVEAYQTLYHNSIAYGRTKAVQAESGLAELEKEQKIRETQRDALIVTRRELELRAVVRSPAFAMLHWKRR